MFNHKETPKYQSMLERELELTIASLRHLPTDSEEYAKALAHVERLHELFVQRNNKPSRVSPDVRATVAANLLGIMLILRHENVNVITSKALSFVIRPR